MTKTTHGRVHGRAIELDEDLGVAEGQEVEIQVQVISKVARTPGEGFLPTGGCWPTTPNGIRSWRKSTARKLERRPQSPDLGGAMSFLLDTDICSRTCGGRRSWPIASFNTPGRSRSPP